MKDDTSDGISIESTVLAAIDEVVKAQTEPLNKAISDSFKAKWYSIISVFGLVLALISIAGTAKALQDSRKASSNYRNDNCIRENKFRMNDTAKWEVFIEIFSRKDTTRPPLTPLQVERQKVLVVEFTKFLQTANAPIDCVQLSKSPN